MPWLSDSFVYPLAVPIPGGGYHLRPITPADTELDYQAVMSSPARLWSLFGEVWGWPKPDMTTRGTAPTWCATNARCKPATRSTTPCSTKARLPCLAASRHRSAVASRR